MRIYLRDMTCVCNKFRSACHLVVSIVSSGSESSGIESH